MTLSLKKAVGRIVTVRGSSHPLNFTPLKEFHLDVAQDAALIIAMRTVRETGKLTLLNHLPIQEWMVRVAIGHIMTMLKAVSPHVINMVEVGAGIGSVFEYLKSVEQELKLHNYTAIGPEDERIRFAMMHDSGGHMYSYSPTLDLPLAPSTAVLINHNQAIRLGHQPSVDWLSLTSNHPGPVVAALRVSISGPSERITVNGHRVKLPSLAETRASLSSQGCWYGNLIKGFDEGLFLPNEKPSSEEGRQQPTTALMLAMTAGHESALQELPRGFEPV
jgi:hypothetical protein